MSCQKIINVLDTLNQPCNFRRRNLVEINDDARGTSNTNNQINFKTTMLKSSHIDYSDAYMLMEL